MFRLKANKNSLYKLVGKFENLPPMRRVTITKAYRAPDWWLKWTDADGLLVGLVIKKTLPSGGTGRSSWSGKGGQVDYTGKKMTVGVGRSDADPPDLSMYERQIQINKNKMEVRA